MSRKVLIVGSGVAGMRASYDLASVGFEVTLLEYRTYTGGTLMQLDKQFPTDSCGICRMQPRTTDFEYAEFCPRKDFYFPGVEVLRDVMVEKIDDGENNAKIVVLRHKGLIVSPDLCIGCGKCVDICPIEIKDEFNGFFETKKAIDRASPYSIYSLYSIDEEHCTRCGECVKVCPTDAITLGDETIETREFDAILLTPGFEEFIPEELTEYGWGVFPDVVTSIELERLYSPIGPNFGQLKRPTDSKEPESIAFIQCVGSRCAERPYCSSACCMYSMKEARQIKHLLPNLAVKIFFMDIRAFGKDYYRYQLETEKKGIEMVRCRVPKVYCDENTNQLSLSYETESGERISEGFGMVVLSIAQVVTPSIKKLAKNSGVDIDDWGFAVLPKANSLETTAKRVFAAGSFVSPKDIADAVTESSAATAEIAVRLGTDEVIKQKSLKGNPPITGKIAIVLDSSIIPNSDDLIQELSEMHRVEKAIIIKNLTTPNGMKEFQKFISDNEFESVIIAACQPYTYLAKLAFISRENIENPPDIHTVDLFQVIQTVQRNEWNTIFKRQIAMSVASAAHGRPQEMFYDVPPEKITKKRVAIVGAGMAGLTAAKTFVDMNIPVTLVEKSNMIGGVNLNGIGNLNNLTTGKYIAGLIKDIKDNPKVEIITEASVYEINGSVGDFKIWIAKPDNSYKTVEAGAIIIATGAKAYETEKFNLSRSSKIILWDEFERKIINNNELKEIVFIQCADCRNDKRPWCNRICCAKTIELSLKIKEKNPKSRIWVLNRDIMSYGHNELDYLKSRDVGVLFVRYNSEYEPSVELDGEDVVVKVRDPLLDAEIAIKPDYVVLQTGVEPNGDERLEELLETTDGFWDGLDTKFSPQETKLAGVFVAGSGRMPMRALEAIEDARAAAIQAAKYLLVESIPCRNKVAYVRERVCVGCQYCIPMCPYEARVWDEFTRKVTVDRERCMGCGACSVACPSEATVMINSDKNRMFAQIIEALR